MTTKKDTFRISYRIDRWNNAQVIDAETLDQALAVVRKQGATSIRNVTIRCDGKKRDGSRCERFQVNNQCPAHRADK